MFPIYRNQSIDLQRKSVDWFLYDGGTFVVNVLKILSSSLLETSETFLRYYKFN